MTLPLAAVVDRLRAEGLLVGTTEVPDPELGRVVTGVTTDSRKVAPGFLFCAVRGTAGDGHRHLADVASAGAVGAVVEAREPSLPLPQIAVSDGRKAAAFAGAEFYGDPWKETLLIGVTGT